MFSLSPSRRKRYFAPWASCAESWIFSSRNMARSEPKSGKASFSESPVKKRFGPRQDCLIRVFFQNGQLKGQAQNRVYSKQLILRFEAAKPTLSEFRHTNDFRQTGFPACYSRSLLLPKGCARFRPARKGCEVRTEHRFVRRAAHPAHWLQPEFFWWRANVRGFLQ
jgi:hypothetical protein